MTPGLHELSLEEAVALGSDVWRGAAPGPGGGCPFGGWAWHAAWLRATEPERVADTRVLTVVGSGGDVRAIVPLAGSGRPWRDAAIRRVAWATGEDASPDHRAVAIADEEGAAGVADGLEGSGVDVLSLDDLADGDPGAARLERALADRGWRIWRETAELCPVLELPGDWETWLASLSGKRRQTIRRKERKARRDHELEVIHHEGDDLRRAWCMLRSLHERRWSEETSFTGPREQRFHGELVDLLAEEGALWLTTLHAAGRPVAAWYGMAAGDTVYFYQSGRDPDAEVRSVGSILHGIMIRRTMERGLSRYDFLRGDEAYKRRWATSVRRTVRLVAYGPTPGGRLALAADLLSARSRVLRSDIRRRAPEPVVALWKRLRAG